MHMQHVVPASPELQPRSHSGCNSGEASSCKPRHLDGGARMEVLLRHKAFKPKAMKGGAAINSKACLDQRFKMKTHLH